MHTAPARIASLALAMSSVVWHLREISRLATIPAPPFPLATTAVTLASTLLAVWVWFGSGDS